MAVGHGDTLGPEALGVLLLEPGDEPALGVDDAPPRNGLVGHPQVVAHGARRVGETGFLGHLAVGHDLPGYESTEHGEHAALERPHQRSLPMSDVPEADAIEQAEPVDPKEESTDPPRIRDDVPEADALEQSEPVPDLDPDRGRD
jgi:hypothetical protein